MIINKGKTNSSKYFQIKITFHNVTVTSYTGIMTQYQNRSPQILNGNGRQIAQQINNGRTIYSIRATYPRSCHDAENTECYQVFCMNLMDCFIYFQVRVYSLLILY